MSWKILNLERNSSTECYLWQNHRENQGNENVWRCFIFIQFFCNSSLFILRDFTANTVWYREVNNRENSKLKGSKSLGQQQFDFQDNQPPSVKHMGRITERDVSFRRVVCYVTLSFGSSSEHWTTKRNRN